MGDNIESNNDAINPNVGDRKAQTFNLIIGIATLLIALLGATFAYFTATARSNTGEVTVKSAMVSINFNRGTEISASNLIPSSEKVALLKFQKSMTPFVPTEEEGYVKDYEEYVEENGTNSDLTPYLDRRCIDAVGREVCSVFWFSVTSEGQVGENTDILASIQVEKNEFDNLSYLVYEVEYARNENQEIINDKYGFGIVESYRLVSQFPEDETAPIREEIPFAKFGKLVSVFDDEGAMVDTIHPVSCLFGEIDDVSDKRLDDVSRCKPFSISNVEEHNYQIVIWLEETGVEQPEQGKTFNGTVMVEIYGDANAGNGNRITGQE